MSFVTFGKDQYHLQKEMQIWCEERFGAGKWIGDREVKEWNGMSVNWTMHSMFGNTTFSFKNPKDYTMFILRWL